MNSENNLKINPWLIAIAVILPTFMEVLDSSIVSVCLTNIGGNLAASTTEATWVQTSYLISNAIVLPASAWFASFFGRKRFLLGCILLFTVASALCGFANSLGMLVVSRIIQGAGGGALVPLSQAILLESFPPAKRGLAMAAYGLGVIIAPAIGPVIGGWVTDSYSWRWLFFMNLPVGLLASWLVQRYVFDPQYIRTSKPGKIDMIGFGLLTLWLGTMQTVLDKGQDADWFGSIWIRWFTAISVVAFIGFVLWELRQKEPLAQLRVFKDRNFTVGTLLISVAAVLVYGPITLLPLFLQGVMGYTSLQSGLTQMSRGLACFFMMPLVGLIIGKVDDRKLIGIGFLLAGISGFLFAGLNPFFAPRQIFWPNFIQGVGMSLCMVPLMTLAVGCLLYTSPSPRDYAASRMPSSA